MKRWLPSHYDPCALLLLLRMMVLFADVNEHKSIHRSAQGGGGCGVGLWGPVGHGGEERSIDVGLTLHASRAGHKYERGARGKVEG